MTSTNTTAALNRFTTLLPEGFTALSHTYYTAPSGRRYHNIEGAHADRNTKFFLIAAS